MKYECTVEQYDGIEVVTEKVSFESQEERVEWWESVKDMIFDSSPEGNIISIATSNSHISTRRKRNDDGQEAKPDDGSTAQDLKSMGTGTK